MIIQDFELFLKSFLRRKDKPLYIAFDGINGAGKSTIIKQLKVQAIFNREPGGSNLNNYGSEEIAQARHLLRKAVLEQFNEPHTVAYLLAADRHLQSKIINSHILSDQIIIQDRTFLSTIAFQGYGCRMDMSFLHTLINISCYVKPDLIFLFDLPVEVASARLRERNSAEIDQFERFDEAFHERVRTGFLAAAKDTEVPVILIDAERNSSDIINSVDNKIKLLASKWRT